MCSVPGSVPVLEGESREKLRFHLQLQLEPLSKQSHTACHGLVAWGGWGTQQPCLSEEVSRAQLGSDTLPGAKEMWQERSSKAHLHTSHGDELFHTAL